MKVTWTKKAARWFRRTFADVGYRDGVAGFPAQSVNAPTYGPVPEAAAMQPFPAGGYTDDVKEAA